MKLDLHGTKHEDVYRKLDVFFWECMRRNITQIEIVTGMSDKMKEIVMNVSAEYNFKVSDFNINQGSLFINI
jgi:DNA-nicking Smr family endonuclease